MPAAQNKSKAPASQTLQSQLRLPLRIPQLIPRNPSQHMRLGRRHVYLVVIAHRVRRLAVLARHPPLDIRRCASYLVAVGVYYNCCIWRNN